MARPTQLWPGERMRTFFRSIFRGETGVSDELADRLADVCERHINRMLVWNGEPTIRPKSEPKPDTQPQRPKQETPEAQASEPVQDQQIQSTDSPQIKSSHPVEESIEDISNTEAGAPWSAEHLEPEQTDTGPRPDAQPPQASPHQTHDQEPAFDPFAFSAIVILARSGADALMQRLKKIKSAQHLRELAIAQHLGVEPSVKEAPKLRKAIVSGAKQRLADRRAAAS